MNNNQKIGVLGERLACDFLTKKKYKIIERNYLRKWGELDIIASAPDKTLVFFEVKAMNIFGGNGDGGLKPEDQLTRDKLRKLQKTAITYANSHPKLISDKKGWRIDLIAIDMDGEKLFGEIRHYENI